MIHENRGSKKETKHSIESRKINKGFKKEKVREKKKKKNESTHHLSFHRTAAQHLTRSLHCIRYTLLEFGPVTRLKNIIWHDTKGL